MQNLIKDARYSKVKEMVDKAKWREREFCQTRSAFQIEKFIGGDEYTLASKYRHVSHNCYVTMKEAERTILQIEEFNRNKCAIQRKIDNAMESMYSHDYIETNWDIELIKLNRSIEDAEIRVAGLLKEIDIMTQICEALEKKNGGPITYEQFEAEEPEYWRVRLANQMHQTMLGSQLGVGEGNYKAYLNSIATPDVEGSINKIVPFNISSSNDVAVTALQSIDGVRQIFLKQAN